MRGESQMTNNGNLAGDECADQINPRPFNFDCFGAGFFHKADSVGNPLGNLAVIAAEGHIGNDQSASYSATNGRL